MLLFFLRIRTGSHGSWNLRGGSQSARFTTSFAREHHGNTSVRSGGLRFPRKLRCSFGNLLGSGYYLMTISVADGGPPQVYVPYVGSLRTPTSFSSHALSPSSCGVQCGNFSSATGTLPASLTCTGRFTHLRANLRKFSGLVVRC